MNIFQIVLVGISSFFLGYLALLSFLALIAKKNQNVFATQKKKFVVVIPAHNEELAIPKTLQSLLRLSYPKTHYEIIVIADNCTDRTAEIAASFQATVYERKNNLERGKGYALRWCFDKLLSRKPAPDAVVVVDADSEVSENFLSVMNAYLERGALAIQSSDVVKPQQGSWSSEAIRLGFLLFNVVRPLGKSVLHCSVGLRGNGMCFRSDVLRRVPWQAFSKAEDLEYGLVLLLEGITVTFAREATVLATMPTQAVNAQTQRARWETGRYPVVRKYVPLLLQRAFKKISLTSLDSCIDLITPPFVNIVLFVCVVFLMNVFLWIIGVEGMFVPVAVWFGVLLLAFSHVIVGLIAIKADRETYAILWQIPRYALWKILLYTKLVRSGQSGEWVRTTREQVSSK